MSTGSPIEWTEATWNPVTGCSRISPGCEHCYAERMSRRLKAMGQPNYVDGFAVREHPNMLDVPRRWRAPRQVFVNSMGDLFHPEVSVEFIHEVFNVISATPRHTYQLLTKRSTRLVELADQLPWPSNLWMGVTVEDRARTTRIDDLRQVPSAVRFLSVEPLLESLGDVDLEGIHWVIVGGESGPGARSMAPEWAREVRDQCLETRTPFFFKQWGGRNKKAAGRFLDGRTWDERPEISERTKT